MSTKTPEIKQPDFVDIRIRKVEGEKLDGTKFTAYETTDKNKNRLSVRFTEDNPNGKPTESCTIRLRNFNVDYWVDRRKLYPILRVRKHELITSTPKTDSENPLI